MTRTINGVEYPDDLSGADLRNANLKCADIRYADLSSANLKCADIRYADLRNANLKCADLRNANLKCADLRYANLKGADLRGADLKGANLKGADLRGAALRGADLKGAKLNWCVGNGSEIITLQTRKYHINYNHTHIHIGCESHTIDEWYKFDDDTILQMDVRALEWWKAHKEWLFKAIELNPAATNGEN